MLETRALWSSSRLLDKRAAQKVDLDSPDGPQPSIQLFPPLPVNSVVAGRGIVS